MTKEKITQEFAQVEFDRFIEMMDIDIDPDDMNEEDKASLETQKKKLIKAMVKGSLYINDNGEPVYTTQRDKEPKVITFHESDGGALMAMDKRARNADVGKMFASLGEITKTSSATFVKMKQSDLKICMAIGALFLG